MAVPIPPEAVIVSKESVESSDPYDLIDANISFINALLAEHLRPEEIATDALRSYYVDYYLAEVNNGGFSQFVYNSCWNPQVVALIREGLQAMGAVRHLALLEEGVRLVADLGPERLQTFLDSEYFGDNVERDALNAIDEQFFAIDDEDLISLNAAWLRQLPHLVVLTAEQMAEEVERRARAIPDREARIAAALASEPRYLKLIRALCAHSGQQLVRVTAGDPSHRHAGQQTLAWHFLTDQGHHYMVEADGKAILFEGETHRRVCELDMPEDETEIG